MTRSSAPLHLLFITYRHSGVQCKDMSQHTCEFCGNPIDFSLYGPHKILGQTMHKKVLCFDCAYWLSRIERITGNDILIDGGLYHVSQILQPQGSNQCRRRDLDFIMNQNDRSIYAVTEKRFLAMVPDRFLCHFTEMYRFITMDTYTHLNKCAGLSCTSKGCWDRYHCFFYNKEIEGNRPWNKISKNHKPGGEMCESFLNKNTMYVNCNFNYINPIIVESDNDKIHGKTDKGSK